MSRRRVEWRSFGVGASVLFASFFWFWYWRPLGFYGGDSELIDRLVTSGEWFRKRGMLGLAEMQLAHQIFSVRLGWPVPLAISLLSCLAGAASVLCCWLCFRKEAWGPLAFLLVVMSGHSLLYHGSIECYAAPTAVLMLWILAIHRAQAGVWPAYSLPLSFSLMTWHHLMALFLLPSLMVSAWLQRERLRSGEWRSWGLALAPVPLLFALTEWGEVGVGEGVGFRDLFYFFDAPGTLGQGSFFSWDHLGMKGSFLWVGTHVTAPLAILTLWKERGNPLVQQIGGMALGALVFLVFFHPDRGALDWDLFLLPSLPITFLAVRHVLDSPCRIVWTGVWIAAFAAVWLPRVPEWAHLSERGLAMIEIRPPDAECEFRWLDERTGLTYPVYSNRIHVPGGRHQILTRKPGYLPEALSLTLAPGEQVTLSPAAPTTRAPFAEEIRNLADEAEFGNNPPSQEDELRREH